MKKLYALLSIFLFVGGIYAQDDVPFCNHQGPTSQSFGSGLLPKSKVRTNQPDSDDLANSDGCADNDLWYGDAARGPKTIRLRFHVVQDQDGERNFPASVANSIFQDMIDRSNEKLGDNKPANHYYGDNPPPVRDINIFFENAGIEYYQSTNWPNTDNGWNDDPTAINVRLREDPNRWKPQPTTVAFVSKTDPSNCGGNDGSFTISGAEANEAIEVYYSFDGGALNSQNVTADGNGNATVSGLAAGEYSDVHLDFYDQRSNSIRLSLKDPGSPTLSINTLSSPTACGSADGGALLIAQGIGSTSTLHYTFEGQSNSMSIVPIGNFVVLQNLGAGPYSNVYVESTSGCKSNAISFNIVDQNAPVISLGDVAYGKCNNGQGSTGTFDIQGLTDGVSYTLHLRTNNAGNFVTSTISSTNGIHEVSKSGGYYEAFVSQNGCRSNTLRLRLGEDCKPSYPGGSSGGQSSKYFNAYTLYHRYLYRATPIQSPYIGEPYGNTESYSKYLDVFSAVVIHEIGHKLSLDHPFETYEDCDDTPQTPKCDISNGWFGSNNFMDWNCGPTKRAFTPCQIEKMHNVLNTVSLWQDVTYTCSDPTHVSDIEVFADDNTGLVTVWNDYSGPYNVSEFWNIQPLDGSGDHYYSSMPYLQFSMMTFEGQDIEICGNTRDENGCVGTEDCETVSLPEMDECRVDQVTGINLVTDANGVATSLDPQSLSTKPHLWAYVSQNGTTLSSTCEHEPDIVYSPISQYMGDVLTLCLQVMGTPMAGPCTTEVCTVITIPPAVPECIGSGSADFIYYPERYNQPPQNNFYALVLEATSFSSPIYEHIWVIEDRRSGQTFTETGRIVSLGSRDIVTRTSRLNPDLRVCHIVIHQINDCIVAKHCEEVQPDCRQSSSFGVVNNLSFNMATKVLSYTFNLPDGPSQDITYIRNGSVSTPTSVTTSGTSTVTYTVTYQYNTDCGSARIELITLAENTNGTRYCNFSEDQILWGNHPCKIKDETPVVVGQLTPAGGGGRREGQLDQQDHYDIRLAPNPTDAFTTIYLNSEFSDDINIQVMDLNGRIVRQQGAGIQQGENAIRLEVNLLSPGLYFIKINGRKNGFAKLEVM